MVNKFTNFKTDERKRNLDFRVPINDSETVLLPVYRVPTKYLRYNFNNARIRADLDAYQARTGIKLKEGDNEYSRIIQKALLHPIAKDEIHSKHLAQDLKKRGQLDPGVATKDGILIDGNRRLAVFRTILKIPEMDIVFLPEDWDKNQLKELEIRMQVSYDFKQGYSLITQALEFRYLVDVMKWELRKIGKIVKHMYTQGKIDRMVRTIDNIDEYLKHLPPKGQNVKQYERVEHDFESFENLQSYLDWSDLRTPKKYDFQKRFGFQLIAHPESNYQHLRKFGQIIKNKELYKELESQSVILQGKYTLDFLQKNLVNETWFIFNNVSNSLKEHKEDPKTITKQVLTKLQKINTNKIRRNDLELIDLLDEIYSIIESMRKRL